jgi:HK97 family phage major capsid protein
MANPTPTEIIQTITAANVALAARIEKLENRPVEKGLSALPAEPRDREAEKAWGFQSFGHFAQEVQRSKAKGSPTEIIQKRFGSELVTKAATGMGELIGSDGGFLVPPQFSDKLFERVYKENDLLKRTDQYTVSGNSMVFPRNAESSRATGSRWGGVRGYWLQEGATITRSAPTFGRLTLQLHKLACIAAVTEELLQDSGIALNQYLNRAFPNEISFLVGDALVRGTGAGQPIGIKGADCTVTVTRSVASHIVLEDIVAMWARAFRGMSNGEESGLVWYVNQDTSPDLYKMSLGIGAAGVSAYMPPGGLSGKPYSTLMGAPVIEIEWCDTLGTSGDIILADMSQMVSISKGGMETQSSMHLYFDSDQQAFRTTFRLDAQPWWATALTPYKGTATQSPFVILS